MGRQKKNLSPDKPPSDDVLPINHQFAERYEASKRKQLLSTVPAALLESGSEDASSSEDEDEDELGELLTKGIDRRVRETLEAIRNKDPRIYDKNAAFFEAAEDANEGGGEVGEGEGEGKEGGGELDSEDEPVAGWEAVEEAARAEMPKMTLKDYVRETLLKDGKLSDSDEEEREGAGKGEDRRRWQGKNGYDEDDDVYVEPQPLSGPLNINGALKRGLISSDEESGGDNDGNDGSDEEDFFKKKKKSEAEVEADEKDFEKFLQKQKKKVSAKAGEELLLHSYLENEKPDEKERFLRDFVLNNGWLDKNAADAPHAGDYEIEIDTANADNDSAAEDEDDFDDKADAFEAKHNFRFEDPEGAQVVSHARDVQGSMRRLDDRRKRARDAKKRRKEQEKVAKTEDIKRLKNLKKREVQARLLAIQEAAGDGIDVSGIDLDADFDPDAFNAQMETKFGDEYYAQKDAEMKELTKEGVAVASEKRLSGRASAEAPEEIRQDVNKLMDEYYNLDYEDIVGGVPMRFNYKKVEPEAFSMTANEILAMDDKELNRIVSLKRIAPYRANREIKKDSWRVRDALRKQRNAPREHGGYPESEMKVLARAREAEEERGGREKGKKRKGKKRNRPGSGSFNDAHEHDGKPSGHAPPPDVKHQGRVDVLVDAADVHAEENGKKSARKRKKRQSKSETVEGLSASRREAYNLE